MRVTGSAHGPSGLSLGKQRLAQSNGPLGLNGPSDSFVAM